MNVTKFDIMIFHEHSSNLILINLVISVSSKDIVTQLVIKIIHDIRAIAFYYVLCTVPINGCQCSIMRGVWIPGNPGRCF